MSVKDALFDVSGKTVVITGGLGLLGQQFARALLSRNAKVAILDCDISSSRADNFLKKQKNKKNVRIIEADVTRRRSLEDALQCVSKQWGNPYGLINNAAMDAPPDSSAQASGPFESYAESEWDRVMAVNVKGVFLACQVFGRQMAKAGAGSIINVGSIYGLVSPDQRVYEYRTKTGEKFFKPAVYSASKSALLNFTRYLATYWADRNIRVNSLTLGGVFNDQDKQFLKGYEARVPAGRMARPDEYNGAVLFLLSNASSYMTGSNLVIDGGWTAW